MCDPYCRILTCWYDMQERSMCLCLGSHVCMKNYSIVSKTLFTILSVMPPALGAIRGVPWVSKAWSNVCLGCIHYQTAQHPPWSRRADWGLLMYVPGATSPCECKVLCMHNLICGHCCMHLKARAGMTRPITSVSVDNTARHGSKNQPIPIQIGWIVSESADSQK